MSVTLSVVCPSVSTEEIVEVFWQAATEVTVTVAVVATQAEDVADGGHGCEAVTLTIGGDEQGTEGMVLLGPVTSAGLYEIVATGAGDDGSDGAELARHGPLVVEEAYDDDDEGRSSRADDGDGSSAFASARGDGGGAGSDEEGLEQLRHPYWSYSPGQDGDFVDDVVVFCPEWGESAPDGYIALAKNLNAGNEGADMRLAFRRVAGRERTSESRFVVGLGVLFPDLDAECVTAEMNIINATVDGYSADLNGNEGKHMAYVFTIYGAADGPAPPIHDITVLDKDTGDALPPGYSLIPYSPSGYDADTNTGTSGHDIFLAYATVGAECLYEGNAIALRSMYSQFVRVDAPSCDIDFSTGLSPLEVFVTERAAGCAGGRSGSVDDGFVLRSLETGQYVAVSADTRDTYLADAPSEETTFVALRCGGVFALLNEATGLFLDVVPGPSVEPVYFEIMAAITQLAATGSIVPGTKLGAQSYDFVSKNLNRETDGDYLNVWYKRGGPVLPIVALKIVTPNADSDSDDEDEEGGPSVASPSETGVPDGAASTAAADAPATADAADAADAADSGLPPLTPNSAAAAGAVFALSEDEIARKRSQAVEGGGDDEEETMAEFVARHQDAEMEAILKQYALVDGNDGYEDAAWTGEPADLNEGNEDGYIQVPWVVRSDADGAASAMPIFQLDVLFDHEVTPGGWIKDPTDLNEGAGGSYVYLTYARTMLPTYLRVYLEEQRELREKEVARRIRVARLKQHAELTAVCESLADALDAAEAAAGGSGGAGALPPVDEESFLDGGMDNAGNTCYMDSILFAMFGTSRAFEYLLYPNDVLELAKPTFNPFAFEDSYSDSDSDAPDPAAVQAAKVRAIRTLQAYLRDKVIGPLRTGTLLDADTMELVRFLFRWAGWESGGEDEDNILFGWDATQQDAAELLDNTLDWLGAPYIASVRKFALRGVPDPESASIERFRTVRVSMPRKKKSKSKRKSKRDPRFNLGYMLDQDLNNNPLEGFKREPSDALQELLDANPDTAGPMDPEGEVWSSVIRLQPGYINGDETERLAWDTIIPPGMKIPTDGTPPFPIAVPVVVKRFNNDLNKLMGRIAVPLEIAPTAVNFLDKAYSSDGYVLRLRSAVCHTGRKLNRGHYYTYARHDRSDGTPVWLKFDDLAAEGSKIEPVAFPGPYYRMMCKQCYVLFYELTRVDASAPASAPAE